MRWKGQLVSWKDDRGFGFIATERSDRQVFVHIKAFANRGRRPQGNERVSFEVVTDDQNRLQARSVAFLDESAAPMQFAKVNSLPMCLACWFMCSLAAVTCLGRLPNYVFAHYLISSVITFFVYAWDKSAAVAKRWRTAENSLHLCDLLGGWPGGILAQQLYRHKTSKRSFQVAFWVTVAANCGAVALLLHPNRRQLLEVALESVRQ
ncbi:cold shock and DUF1294 domain-containing protein [Roseiconus lacunae]|uniref:DUF1294 domain-containing protein n=1 Tax=Roseiconus lacunae TaxID=2605694 RepID=UPI003092A307|nr:cold shock and DUF1294 domain-containing protein [Stieleria sp. HD01]